MVDEEEEEEDEEEDDEEEDKEGNDKDDNIEEEGDGEKDKSVGKDEQEGADNESEGSPGKTPACEAKDREAAINEWVKKLISTTENAIALTNDAFPRKRGRHEKCDVANPLYLLIVMNNILVSARGIRDGISDAEDEIVKVLADELSVLNHLRADMITKTNIKKVMNVLAESAQRKIKNPAKRVIEELERGKRLPLGRVARNHSPHHVDSLQKK